MGSPHIAEAARVPAGCLDVALQQLKCSKRALGIRLGHSGSWYSNQRARGWITPGDKEKLDQLVEHPDPQPLTPAGVRNLPTVMVKPKRRSKQPAVPTGALQRKAHFLVSVPEEDASSTRALLAACGYAFEQVVHRDGGDNGEN